MIIYAIIPYDKLKEFIPGGDNIGNFITLFAWMFVVLLVGSILVALFYFYGLYNKKITIVKGGQIIKRDRARTIKIGTDGVELMYAIKMKKYLPAYGRTTGRNNYMFAIAENGMWHNVTLGDIDTELNKLGLHPVHADMRLMHSGIRRNIQQRFDKVNWWQKNAAWLINMALIVVILVFLWLTLRDASSFINSLNSAAESINSAAKELGRAAAQFESGGLKA